MTVFVALFRKGLLDARWMLGIIAASLFGLTWLFVYVANRVEEAMRPLGRGMGRGSGMLRGLGGSAMDFSTAAIEMAFWNHPFVLLIVAVWAIARGSGSVAGEIEKGTMDLILSRPVSRLAYLGSQIGLALAGFAIIAAAMVAGNLIGERYNRLDEPLSALALMKPSLNLVAFGWAIFGYTFLASAVDHARWRASLIGSAATLAGFIALVISGIPSLEDWKWLEKLSVFKAYNPVEVVTTNQTLAFNASILGAIGLVGVVGGAILFNRRDLPAGS